MQEDFRLHNQLEADTYEVLDLKLCKLLLMNNSLFPWLILVPQKNNLKEIIDLEFDEQVLLLKEISQVSNAIKNIYVPDKLNIAALGNIVEQLHIHIIARSKNDKMWPKPVFGGEVEKYKLEEIEIIKTKFRDELNV